MVEPGGIGADEEADEEALLVTLVSCGEGCWGVSVG
jgi:hypothetical protein